MDKQTLKSEWGYSSFRFFPKELHPTILKVGQKKFTDESRFEHHDEIELILIRSGTGTLIVNNTAYSISRGTTALFMSFDFHKFVPDPGSVLLVDYFQISIGTYMFVCANPYYEKIDADISQTQFTPLYFEESEIPDIERLFAEICTWRPKKTNQLDRYVYCIMELIGKLNRCAYQL